MTSERTKKRFSLKGRIPALLATLAAPALIYFVVRTAAVGLSPAAALQLPPTDPLPLLKVRIYQSATPNYRLPSETLDVASKAAAISPLAFEPFFLHAFAAQQAGQLDKAIPLMEEARHRRSSFPPLRAHLAFYYARAGRYSDLFAELEALFRLSPQTRQAVMPEMAKLVADPRGRVALAQAFASDAQWRDDFFIAALDADIEPGDALALFQESRRRGVRNLGPERRLVVRKLLDSGEPRRAREIWLSSLPESERQRHLHLYDGAFETASALPPFGWTFQSNELGRAQIARDSAGRAHLSVDYFGGRPVVLADQTLALAPGAYRLRYAVQGEGTMGSARLSWVIFCGNGESEAARSSVETLTAGYRPREEAFRIGSDCSSQKLRLLAEPGDIAYTVHLQFANLAIVRQGASE